MDIIIDIEVNRLVPLRFILHLKQIERRCVEMARRIDLLESQLSVLSDILDMKITLDKKTIVPV